MITNEEIKDNLELYNMIYIPNELLNQNYKYTLSNDTLTVIKNTNCTQNYNTTYCDCEAYNIKYNIKAKLSQCNANPTNNIVEYSQLTNNVNYSDRLNNLYVKQYGIYLIILIGIFVIVGTFKRNSRNI